eukprot:5416682-Alexandrium_andersonii.AAC.1
MVCHDSRHEALSCECASWGRQGRLLVASSLPPPLHSGRMRVASSLQSCYCTMLREVLRWV